MTEAAESGPGGARESGPDNEERTTGPAPIEAADIRDAATDGIRAWAEKEGHDILVAHSALTLGVVYVKGQTSFIVEVHDKP